jgi:diguanylate cyclase (GGDEF)-like protein
MNSEAAASTAPLAVLVVDDEVWIAEELALGLEESGLSVAMATSAATAQAMLAERADIGVVVTDIRMPGEDGLSMVRRLLTDRPAQHAVEAVVMTGHATIDDAVAAVRAGAFDFVRKPFTLTEMTAVVQAASARAAAKRAAATAPAAVGEAGGRPRDPVTGLPDRAAFAVALSAALEAGPDQGRAIGVIVLDLDQFAALNQGSGNATGDAVLAETGRRLVEALGSGWLVARIGSDEFAAMTDHAPDAVALQARAEALRAVVERPIAIGDRRVRLTASLGVAHGATSGRLAPDAAATLAAAAARRAGGARCVAFEPELQHAAERRLAIAQDLQHAIARGQMTLDYQPIFNLPARRLAGFEALLRWRHPTLGAIPPSEFIPVAEEGRLILDLGAFALEEAARQLAAWRGLAPRLPYVSVNVSGRQFDDADVPGLFAAAIARHGIPAEAIVAEVTETLALGSGAPAAIAALQALGVRVALDDFGVGHSSLGVLGGLRVDVVKLDRSLVAGIGTQPREQRLFNGLVATLRALGLTVAVEGIETEAQLDMALLAGCHAAQGHLLGRAMSAAAAGALIAGAG